MWWSPLHCKRIAENRCLDVAEEIEEYAAREMVEYTAVRVCVCGVKVQEKAVVVCRRACVQQCAAASAKAKVRAAEARQAGSRWQQWWQARGVQCARGVWCGSGGGGGGGGAYGACMAARQACHVVFQSQEESAAAAQKVLPGTTPVQV